MLKVFGKLNIGLLFSTVMLTAPYGAVAQPTASPALQERHLIIGIANQAPWGYVTKDGDAAGFYPDIVRTIFRSAGISKLDFVVVDFGALIPSLLAKRIDAAAAGLAITPVRCGQVTFSDPDLAIGDELIVRQGNPFAIHSFADVVRNQNIRMGGGRASTNTEHALEAGIASSRIQQFEGVETGIAALLANRIDAFTLSSASAIAVSKDRNLRAVERASPFKGLVKNGEVVANYAAVAFRPDDTPLRDLYNTGLKQLQANGGVQKIMERYGFTAEEAVPHGLTAKKVCGTPVD
ncbi:transporter substrate-binding domain-containing protein [Paraburkholderia sp. MM5477-R1]|uniref:transporter substrate-binding domain-containing protein n=1 Tax=Paraburkholderia sp. MM5477-R1 TaxID=2991062 RepID=UPI003D1AA37D